MMAGLVTDTRINTDNSEQIDSMHTCTIKCEACAEDGVERVAAAFCVECQDYLCLECSNHHCLPKPMKHHKILFNELMPRRKASTSLSENCSKHKGETLKLYCKNHNAVGCSTCMATVHRTCGSVFALSDLANNIGQSKLCSETKQELLEVENLFKSQRLRIDMKDKQVNKKCYNEVLEELKRRRTEINKQFDKLEQAIAAESAQISNENSLNMKKLFESCSSKLDTILNIKSDLQLLQDTKQEKQLFIALKKTQLQIKQMMSALLNIKAETRVRVLKLNPNTISKSLFVREDSLGHLQVSDSEKNAQVDEKDLFEQIGIGKLIEISSGIIVATDYQRCEVCTYDEKFKKIARTKFATGPWDIAKTGVDIAAVTFPHEKKIKYLYIGSAIQELGEVQVPGFCRGIAALDNKLVVTFTDPPALKILNDVGVVKEIKLDIMCTNIQAPAYVAVDENKAIYVTDPAASLIVKLNSSGVFTGACRSINKPLHICVFSGTLIVSECNSGTIHTLTYDFKKLDTCNDVVVTGDVCVSPAGVSFNAIVMMNDALRELPNVSYVKADGGSGATGSGDGPEKKCVIS